MEKLQNLNDTIRMLFFIIYLFDPFPRREAAAARRAAERGLEIVTVDKLVKSYLCNPSMDFFPYARRNSRTPIDLIYEKKFEIGLNPWLAGGVELPSPYFRLNIEFGGTFCFSSEM